MMTAKNIYRNLCKQEVIEPLFLRDWWLDAVCGDRNWDVALVEQDHAVVAALPYFKTKKGVFNGIQLPPFTPHLGPYIRYPEKKREADRLSVEKQLLTQLIDQLPRFDYFIHAFSPSFTNWLPFYWKGFQQTTKYTYIIRDLSNMDTLVSQFSHAKQKNLKRAEGHLEIGYDLSPEAFYKHHQLSLKKAGQRINYSYDLFKQIYQATLSRESGIILHAADADGTIHSALFLVQDNHTTYNLISSIDPDYRTSGSVTLLIKAGIRWTAQTNRRQFDFEGSMIEGVENSFRQFGGLQTPYFKIMKYTSLPLRLVKGLLYF